MNDTPYPPHTPPAPPEDMKWEYMGLNLHPSYMPRTYYMVFPDGVVTQVGLGHLSFSGRDQTHYFGAVPIHESGVPTGIGGLEPFPESELEYHLRENAKYLTEENPKEAAGRVKCPMHLLSPSAMRETANALGCGAAKYGARNYRAAGINATTYVGAILRHITAWNDGEDLDPESGLSHIAHVSACCDILLDCMATDMMNDDRSKKP